MLRILCGIPQKISGRWPAATAIPMVNAHTSCINANGGGRAPSAPALNGEKGYALIDTVVRLNVALPSP